MTDNRVRSPQFNARHTKHGHSAHSKRIGHTLSREISRDDDYDIDLSEYNDRNGTEVNDTKSSLGRYGSDLS